MGEAGTPTGPTGQVGAHLRAVGNAEPPAGMAVLAVARLKKKMPAGPTVVHESARSAV